MRPSNPAVNAGRLRETVTFEAPPGSDDGAGGQTGGWTRVAVLRAEVTAIGGTEAALAMIDTGTTRYRVRIRRRAVSTGQRLRWQGQALDIQAVLPDADRVWTVLLCEGRSA